MKVTRRHIPELDVTLERLQAGPVVVTCIPDMANVAWPAGAIFAGLSREDLDAAARRSPAGSVDPEGGTVSLWCRCEGVESRVVVAVL
ncbi:hypothetical protein AB4144_60510, partial [Rhizobiaceae sp. 2RAB30]